MGVGSIDVRERVSKDVKKYVATKIAPLRLCADDISTET